MLKLDLQPIPDGFRWRSKYGHLTYSSYLSHEQLVAHAKMITSTPLVGWSVVHETGDDYKHTHFVQPTLPPHAVAADADVGLDFDKELDVEKAAATCLFGCSPPCSIQPSLQAPCARALSARMHGVLFALGRGAPRARRPGVNNDLDVTRAIVDALAAGEQSKLSTHSRAESTGRPPAEQQQQQQLSSSRRRKGRGAAAAGSSSSSAICPFRAIERCAGGVASRRAPRRVRPRASSRERRCYELL